MSNSQESKSIKLIGCGLERKLKISKMNVKFPAVLPNTTLEEDLTIENNNAYPMEVYWQHLTKYMLYLTCDIILILFELHKRV